MELGSRAEFGLGSSLGLQKLGLDGTEDVMEACVCVFPCSRVPGL